jgi:hypothetical protein
LINSDKATRSPASSLSTTNSTSANLVSTSNSTLPNASPGPPSDIGIAQCTADAQNPARAFKLAMKEHSVSHSKVHHDLPNHNKLAELDIGRLEQIVEAVVKTQRDLSRNGQVRVPENFVGAIHHGLPCCSKYNLSDCFVIPCRCVLCHGQKFCGTENLSHSNTNSSNLHSETQAPSELGDDKQVSILYQQQPSDLSGSSKEKCINHRSRRTMKSYSDSVPNAMQTLHRNPLSTQELEISRAGDRSISSLSSSQYHDESRRTIDVDTGNRNNANSRGNNLSDLLSNVSSSHGSNLAHGAAIKGQFDTRYNRFTVTETADYAYQPK